MTTANTTRPAPGNLHLKTLPDHHLTAPPESLTGDTIKALTPESGRIGQYALRFGDNRHPDVSPNRDWFTPRTDFWPDAWLGRPIIYHHGIDEATADNPLVGLWDTLKIDDVGVWLEGQLDLSHRYWRAIQELIRQGKLYLSTESSAHLVRRRPHPDGTNEVLRWPIVAASLTVSPAEPRLPPVAALSNTPKETHP